MKLRDVASYKKGKPTRTIHSGNVAPILTPDYLRNGQAVEYGQLTDSTISVRDNDIVLLWDGSNAGEFFKARRGILGSTMVKFLVNEERLSKSFLFYQLKFHEDFLKNRTNGSGIPHVDKEFLLNLDILDISKNKQSLIATILSKVDEVIIKTEQLIAKYHRIKTGLMQDLLTKGIDENGNIRSEETHEFKDSPLGRIPVEWECVDFGSLLSRIEAGKSPNCPDIPATGDQWGVAKVSSISRNGFNEKENKIVENPIYHKAEYLIKKGDLLISRSNTWELVGESCLVGNISTKVLLSDKSLRIIPNRSLISNFFAFLLLQTFNVKKQINLDATGSSATMKNITQLKIRSLTVSIPKSLIEQKTISEMVKKSNGSIVQLANALNKFRLLKIGLMQDLLSGKVHVTEELTQKYCNLMEAMKN